MYIFRYSSRGGQADVQPGGLPLQEVAGASPDGLVLGNGFAIEIARDGSGNSSIYTSPVSNKLGELQFQGTDFTKFKNLSCKLRIS